MKAFFHGFVFLVVVIELIGKIEAIKVYLKDISIDFGAIETKINIGNYTRDEVFDLDLSIDFTWVTTTIYSPEKDSTITFKSNALLPLDGQEYKSYLLQAPITLIKNSLKIPDFPFYYVLELTEFSFDSIGMAFKFKDESFSFVHHLYKMGEISKKGFGITIDNQTSNSGFLFLGGIPEENLERFPFNASCKVNQTESQWNCNFKTFQINNQVYSSSFISYFQTNVDAILAPEEVMKILNETYFGKYFEDSSCKISYSIFTVQEIVCDCSALVDDITIKFEHEDFSITFNKSSLFREYKSKCFFLIQLNVKEKDKWTLGSKFYQDYIAYFDYEKEEITLYSERPFEDKKGSSNFKKTLLHLVNITSILGGFMLGWAKAHKFLLKIL